MDVIAHLDETKDAQRRREFLETMTFWKVDYGTIAKWIREEGTATEISTRHVNFMKEMEEGFELTSELAVQTEYKIILDKVRIYDKIVRN